MRRILAALAVFSVACAQVHQPPIAGESGIKLRVVTYNIRSGNGNLEQTAATIRGFSPDIVALQEVDVHWSDRSKYVDQAEALAEMLGMNVRFAPIYNLPPTDSAKDERQFGVALLSKYPIVQFRNDTITRLSTQVQNAVPAPAPGLLEAAVDVNGRRIRVFNTHLDYRSDPRVRERQVGEMLAHIGDASIPTIVFGDMNATPDAAELQSLFQRVRDTWSSANGPGYTYPAEGPTKRIDYVLTTRHFVARHARVPDTQASDHRPVVVDLLLQSR